MNELYYGDNLEIFQHFADETFDLIYLDPPFDSGKNYNAFFKEEGEVSRAQIRSFEDIWKWNEDSEEKYEMVLENPERPDVAEMTENLIGYLGKRNDISAYLVQMIPRILEMHRILKPSGSYFLHCNPAAGHYLKVILDVIFGPTNFINEIIWSYRRWPISGKFFQRMHQNIYFYAKQEDHPDRVFNTLYEERSASTKKRFGESKIKSGWSEGRRVPSEMEESESPGTPMRDVWQIKRVPPIKMLYETQKPDELLERIIRATTNEGDLVLDPFCGCGTTVSQAHRLERQWVGIDITHLAIRVIEERLNHEYGGSVTTTYQVHGVPTTVNVAQDLFNRNPLEFQDWAAGLVFGRLLGENEKRHANGGADAIMRFRPAPGADIERVIISVKGGENIKPSDVRDLIGAVQNFGASLGFFITLHEPSEGPRGMTGTAEQAGFYKFTYSTYDEEETGRCQRIQIRTIEQLLNGEGFDFPGRPLGTPKSSRPERHDPGLFDGE